MSCAISFHDNVRFGPLLIAYNRKIMSDIEKLQMLIEKGNQVLSTHKPNPPNVIGFPN